MTKTPKRPRDPNEGGASPVPTTVTGPGLPARRAGLQERRRLRHHSDRKSRLWRPTLAGRNPTRCLVPSASPPLWRQA